MEEDGKKIVGGGVGATADPNPLPGSSSQAAGTVPEAGVDLDHVPDGNIPGKMKTLKQLAEEVLIKRTWTWEGFLMKEDEWEVLEGQLLVEMEGEGEPWPWMTLEGFILKAEKRAMLKTLLVEERELKKTLEGLKTLILPTLAEGNRQIVGKQDEIDQLRKKLLGMKGGMGASSTGEGLSSSLTVPKSEEKGDKTADPAESEFPGVRNPELIFPEEVWGVIFSKLTDPKDLHSCLNTCQLFNQILEPLKNKFLFPLAFPLFCRYLDNELILKCRQICRKWNAAVDQCLENYSSLLPFDEKSFNPRDPDLAPPMKTNGGEWEIHQFSNRGGDIRGKNFLGKMRDHPRNPFVGRAVSLQIIANFEEVTVERDGHLVQQFQLANFLPAEEASHRRMTPKEQAGQFYENLVAFLKQFGKHIWYLNFELRNSHPMMDHLTIGLFGVTTMFQFLTQEIILLCPNLRRVRLGGDVPANWIDDLDLDSLPAAPYLETLQIDKVTHFMGLGLVLDSLIRKHHKQLKKLHVQWETLKSLHFHRKEFPLNWENLVELHVDGDGVEMWEVVPAPNIKPLIRMKMPNLQKLVLTPGTWNDGGWIKKYDFETIMDVTINLSVTTKLSVLRIYKGFEAVQVRQGPGTLFAPPNLTTLEVEHCDWESDYTFLLRFPFLENLIVIWPEEGLYEGNGHEIAYKTGPMPQWEKLPRQQKSRLEKRDLLGLGAKLCRAMYEKGIYKFATIWELLPRLKVFSFQRDVYTRREYQRFVEGRKEIKGSE